MKTCSRCAELKPLTEYHKFCHSSDGLKPRCKTCTATASARYQHTNREMIGAKKREFRRNNRHKFTAYEAARRARKAGNRHSKYDRTEIFERWGSSCCYCDAPAITLDHVTPLASGGADAAANLVAACTPCNSSKGAKSLADWAATF